MIFHIYQFWREVRVSYYYFCNGVIQERWNASKSKICVVSLHFRSGGWCLEEGTWFFWWACSPSTRGPFTTSASAEASLPSAQRGTSGPCLKETYGSKNSSSGRDRNNYTFCFLHFSRLLKLIGAGREPVFNHGSKRDRRFYQPLSVWNRPRTAVTLIFQSKWNKMRRISHSGLFSCCF